MTANTLGRPTKASVISQILSIWQGDRPGADASRFSDLWLFSNILGAVVDRAHTTLDRGINAIFPDTATEIVGGLDFVNRWLATFGLPNGVGGLGRIVEHGTDLIADSLQVTITGAGIGAGVLNGSNWTTAGNLTFKVADAHGALAAGTHTLDMASSSSGAACNIDTGTALTIVTPVANVNDAAVTVKDMTGAADRETVLGGVRRLLTFLRNPPISGNVADWVSVIEGVQPGSLKAFVWPKRESQPYGYGRTDYCALKTGLVGTAAHIGSSDDLYADITAAVAGALQVLLYRNSRQLTLTTLACDVDITIELSDDATADQKCDWDSETGAAITVSSHDAGGAPNKEIVASAVVAAASRTNGMLAGDRVVIGGIVSTVDKAGIVDGLANDSTFRLTYWPYAAGAGALNGLNITSGGGLIGHIDQTDADGNEWTREGVVGVLQTYWDDLGPARGTYAAGGQITDWRDTASVLGIRSDVIQFGDGSITDVTLDDLNGGVVDVTPTAGSGATTERLILDEPTVQQVYV